MGVGIAYWNTATQVLVVHPERTNVGPMNRTDFCLVLRAGEELHPILHSEALTTCQNSPALACLDRY